MPKKLFITACVGALTLTAFALASPVSAQWMVNGATLTGTETKALASGAPVHELMKLKAAGVTIECKGKNFEFGSPQIEAGDKGSTTSLIFTECSADGKCAVSKTIATLPLMEVATLDGALAANISFLPKTKTIFAVIQVTGSECALAGAQPATGKAKFLAPTGQDERLLQLIESKTTEASGELKIGVSPVELRASALLKLATDLPWSFL